MKMNCIVPEIHFIASKKGNELLVYQKYTFAKNCVSKHRVTWACSSRCSKKCKAQVTLSNTGKFQVLKGIHTHPPPVFYVNEQGKYRRLSKRQLSGANDPHKDEEDEEYIERIDQQGFSFMRLLNVGILPVRVPSLKKCDV